MSNKVHSQGKVPFSWENKPGVCKVAARQDQGHFSPPNLPPPPFPSENKNRGSFHNMQIPLPPCGFQQTTRSSSRKSMKQTDDPFLIAYKEITKSRKKTDDPFLIANKEVKKSTTKDQGFGFKNLSIFSCKRSSRGVVEDSIIRLSQIPISRSQREEAHD